MGRQIHVDLDRTIPTPPARVHAALADYHGRARILPANYLDWTVEEGGTGAGTVVSYRLGGGRRGARCRVGGGRPPARWCPIGCGRAGGSGATGWRWPSRPLGSPWSSATAGPRWSPPG